MTMDVDITVYDSWGKMFLRFAKVYDQEIM